MNMLETYRLNVRDDEAPLLPTLAGVQKRITWWGKVRPCWTRFLPAMFREYSLPWEAPSHSYSGVYYTGTNTQGVGWLVCVRCGHKKKYSLVSTKYDHC